MQTLVFNTTTKTVILFDGEKHKTQVLAEFENVPTVRVETNGYYEVMAKHNEDKNIPVLRVPISNTNMFIEK